MESLLPSVCNRRKPTRNFFAAKLTTNPPTENKETKMRNSTDNKVKMSLTTQTILEDFFKNNSYPIGCVVKIKGSSGVHIVHKVFLEECEEPLFLYGTNRSAWHNHEDLTLVSLPSKESYTQLLQDQKVEEDSNPV